MFLSFKKNREDGLPAGVPFIVNVDIGGYPAQTYQVILEKGRTTTVTHTMDFTVGQVIHGVVRDKGTGKPINNFYVSAGIYNKRERGIDTYSDKNGEFWFGGIEPGIYNIIYTSNNGYTGIKIEIKSKEKREIIIEI